MERVKAASKNVADKTEEQHEVHDLSNEDQDEEHEDKDLNLE